MKQIFGFPLGKIEDFFMRLFFRGAFIDSVGCAVLIGILALDDKRQK